MTGLRITRKCFITFAAWFTLGVQSIWAATILIDFGADGKLAPTTGAQVWNNVASERLSSTYPDTNLNSLFVAGNLLDISGADSGITFAAVGYKEARIGGVAVDFTGSLPTNPTGTVLPASAYADSLYTGTVQPAGADDSTYTVTLGNLDPNSTYTLTFLSAFDGGNQNGDPLWTVTGATTEAASLDFATASDEAGFAQVIDMAPDGSNEISIVFSDNPPSGNTNGRWNTLEVTVVTAVPEPGALVLGIAGIAVGLALCSGGTLFR